jgi:GIY-YIG catalytic domain
MYGDPVYFGVTNNPRRRWDSHRNKSNNHYISRAIQIHGPEKFTFEVLAIGERSYLHGIEIAAIAAFGTQQFGYNIEPGGAHPSPIARTRAKLSVKVTAALKGRPTGPHSPEHNAKIAAALKGRPSHPQSPESREKIAAAARRQRRGTRRPVFNLDV